VCVGGNCRYTAINCNDGNPCTIDACDPSSPTGCSNTPIVCNDNNPCTTDRCVGGNCRYTRIPGCSPKQSEPAVVTPAESRNVSLHAYPNPFNDKLNIEFNLQQDSKVTLEVYSISGQRLAVLFEGNVKAGNAKKVEFTADQTEPGMIIYRLQSETGTYYGKAVGIRK